MAREVGRIQALWRYPIKSLRGERLDEVELTPKGLAGDRAYAFREAATGRVLSAKRWGRLLEWGSRYVYGPARPPQLILADGTAINIERGVIEVSTALGRRVELEQAAPDTLRSYEMAIQSPDDIAAGGDQLAAPSVDLPCSAGTFFDAAAVHLLTDATLAALQQACGRGDFDMRRFRPNLLLETDAPPGYLEDAWVGRTLAIGQADASITVLMPTVRCVMTTLPQPDLPRDPDILRTLVDCSAGNAGVYANVEQPGRIRVGDVVTVL